MKSTLRFSVRDLLWLAIVVALFVLWSTARQELATLRKQMARQLAEQRQQLVAQQAAAQQNAEIAAKEIALVMLKSVQERQSSGGDTSSSTEGP